jgi:hypothetical protein
MSSKPWEVLTGQAIASLIGDAGETSADSLRSYLGDKICANLLELSPTSDAQVVMPGGATS